MRRPTGYRAVYRVRKRPRTTGPSAAAARIGPDRAPERLAGSSRSRSGLGVHVRRGAAESFSRQHVCEHEPVSLDDLTRACRPSRCTRRRLRRDGSGAALPPNDPCEHTPIFGHSYGHLRRRDRRCVFEHRPERISNVLEIRKLRRRVHASMGRASARMRSRRYGESPASVTTSTEPLFRAASDRRKLTRSARSCGRAKGAFSAIRSAPLKKRAGTAPNFREGHPLDTRPMATILQS